MIRARIIPSSRQEPSVARRSGETLPPRESPLPMERRPLGFARGDEQKVNSSCASPFTMAAVPIIAREPRENGTRRSLMNSVGNVARVLRLFTPERSVLSVSEVAQLLTLPKSSSSRLLKAMAETGLLTITETAAGYAAGNRIFETARRH